MGNVQQLASALSARVGMLEEALGQLKASMQDQAASAATQAEAQQELQAQLRAAQQAVRPPGGQADPFADVMTPSLVRQMRMMVATAATSESVKAVTEDVVERKVRGHGGVCGVGEGRCHWRESRFTMHSGVIYCLCSKIQLCGEQPPMFGCNALPSTPYSHYPHLHAHFNISTCAAHQHAC